MDNTIWRQISKLLLRKTMDYHGTTNRKHNCVGMDLRLSQPFVSREVMNAHMCIRVFAVSDPRDPIGFAFLKKISTEKCLYITLLVSFESGIGTHLIEFLHNCDKFHEQFIVLRSTDEALPFYVKRGFTLFDWTSLYDGIPPYAIDRNLTCELYSALSFKKSTDAVRSALVFRNWCEYDAKEWPLILLRNFPEDEYATDITRRTSLRLKSKRDALKNLRSGPSFCPKGFPMMYCS